MTSTELIQVQFQPTGKRVELPAESNLLEAARQTGIELNSTCGGEGTCGQCQVIVLRGRVSPPDSDEADFMSQPDLAKGRRLACRTKAHENVIIEVPRESITTSQRLQIDSDISGLSDIQPDPIVRAYPLQLQKPALSDPRADLERIADALRDTHGLPRVHAHVDVIRSLPTYLRKNAWQATAFVRGDALVGLEAPGTRPLGYSVDLGTTKIAVSLVDLESGRTLALSGAPNTQLGFGEDVISRINYVYRTPDGGKTLAEKVQHTLNQLLGDLVKQAGAARSQVAEACIVGNTAMIHLLLRLPVRQLATAPYVSATRDALEVHAADLGLEMAPGARVFIPPNVGGFIGSDHIAMMLACGFDQTSRVTLGIDIGTNTEIVISKPGHALISSASCASGPAFEGAHIREGMRASSGAIERVRITPTQLEIATVQDDTPVGLCGSGIIDTVAELYRVGLINRQGTFHRASERIRAGKNGAEFMLVPAEQSGTGRDIVIDQKDISEIQLAKGAIYAGLNVLLSATQTAPGEVEEVIIAGAFGSYINIDHAVAIGLFPNLPNAHFRQVGNAALVGARGMLISKQARQRAETLRRDIQYQELTANPRFNRIFAQGMLFPNPEENH